MVIAVSSGRNGGEEDMKDCKCPVCEDSWDVGLESKTKNISVVCAGCEKIGWRYEGDKLCSPEED